VRLAPCCTGGAAIGAVLGFLTYGVQWLIGKAGETDIPDVVI
jgi:hypothetical protein